MENSFRGMLAPENRARYIYGGKATITLENPISGQRFTYRITKSEPDTRDPLKTPVWFVSVLCGPDNWTNYKYAGIIYDSGLNAFRQTNKSKISATAPSMIAWQWFLKNMLDTRINVWHEGICCICGRKLTVPESIESGIGPVCAEKAA